MQSARRHADEVQGAMQGIGGDIWSLVPVVGGPSSDVRHLGNALDHLTSAAEVAVDAWPAVNGDHATLFGDGSVDVPTLRTLVAAVDGASTHLDTAQLELGEVSDSALGVGTRAGRRARRGDRRGRARSPVTARRAKPLADVLPPCSAPTATAPTCWPCSTRASSASPAARR